MLLFLWTFSVAFIFQGTVVWGIDEDCWLGSQGWERKKKIHSSAASRKSYSWVRMTRGPSRSRGEGSAFDVEDDDAIRLPEKNAIQQLTTLRAVVQLKGACERGLVAMFFTGTCTSLCRDSCLQQLCVQELRGKRLNLPLPVSFSLLFIVWLCRALCLAAPFFLFCGCAERNIVVEEMMWCLVKKRTHDTLFLIVLV